MATLFVFSLLIHVLILTGFTCFWPNGGGLKESGNPFTTSTESNQSMWENETEEEDEDEHAIESIED